MVDTAQNGTEPILDLDAMLEDLHNDFKGDETESGDASTGNDEGTAEPPPELEATDTDTSPDSELETVLPPGMVQFGPEVLPQQEVDALLELNRRVKGDNDLASRVRQAVLGQQEQATQAVEPDALPVHIDPDNQEAVFLYRQQQRIDAELSELRAQREQELARAAQTAEQARQAEVIDAFRAGMKEFRDEYPALEVQDLKTITDRAAGMGLLEAPEKIGKTLRGGIFKALELAMWDSPEYRARITAGDTVRTKEQQSKDRKQKSSALSSSTGSSPRTQSQEMAPTNRTEVMAQSLEFLRSGNVTD
jgi:hypothetical protein